MALSLIGSDSLKISYLHSVKLMGAEISAYDSTSKQFFVTTPDKGVQIVNAANPTNLVIGSTIDFTSALFNAFGNNVNSVAVKNGIVAVAVANNVKTEPGRVFLLDTSGKLLKSLEVGALPDMLTFSPNGKSILIANEGERDGVNTQLDGKGSVSIIDVSKGAAAATVSTIDFTAFDGTETQLREKGVRIFEGKSASLDLEPEYIAVAPDGKTAMVVLQEANAVAILNLTQKKFTDIVPLGLKSFQGLQTDFSDRDSSTGGASYAPRSDLPVFGMYMPDAIASFTSKGKTYYMTANEGDDRNDFMNPGESVSLSSVNFDATVFPNAALLKGNAVLGRLSTPNPLTVGKGISGDTDGDGDIDQIISYGARSFSILDSKGKVVFDSGDHIERFFASQGVFASGGLFDDTRSDNKGPEPEGVTTAIINGRTLGFVGLERGGGGVMVYDVTDVNNVQFVTYARNAGDISPEGLVYVSAADSPSGQALMVLSNEVSLTLSVFGLTSVISGT
ncbi:MAG: choice-of-anchor I family protein, partial [Methylococcales bacterium]